MHNGSFFVSLHCLTLSLSEADKQLDCTSLISEALPTFSDLILIKKQQFYPLLPLNTFDGHNLMTKVHSGLVTANYDKG